MYLFGYAKRCDYSTKTQNRTYIPNLIDGSKKATDSNQLVLKGVMPTSIYAGYLIYLFANPHNN